VIAAGKAASSMAVVCAGDPTLNIQTLLAVGTHRVAGMSSRIEWHEAAHPLPDSRSVVAGERALEVASAVEHDEGLLLLLSGGASAVVALPIDGLSLEDKRSTIQTMMLAGADIQALNTVRKHLSRLKGGRLAAACRGTTVTLAVSDVIGDDVSVIGSGPGVGDPTTWGDVAAALDRFGGSRHAASLRAIVDRGVRGEIRDTVKPSDASVARAHAAVIACRDDALNAAGAAAARLGYTVEGLPDPVCGEARHAGPTWLSRALTKLTDNTRPYCVLSGGETTVQVTGEGRGGRNQEFVLSVVEGLARESSDVLMASVGTDGIDGPTDAAGALADRTTLARAASLGFAPTAFLDDNNSYDFFAVLGDLIHLGRTDTNVGDLQVLLSAPRPTRP
jgi:glycerate 2-kinase